MTKSDHPLLEIDNIPSALVKKCMTISSFYARFHLFFIATLTLEVICFFLFFPYFSKSAAMAFMPAGLCLTLFSYIVLFIFFQTKKIEQLLQLKAYIALFCQKTFATEEYIEGSDLAFQTIEELIVKEKQLYDSTLPIAAFTPLLIKIKKKMHQRTFFRMKELLFFFNIETIIAFIKKDPITVDAHVALATSYSKLCHLYSQNPSLSHSKIENQQKKLHICLKRGIEEFVIAQELGLNAPWVHAKLAQLYHLQKDTTKEIEQYELLSSKAPEEDTWLLLGILYFSQGQHGKGLTVYNTLLKHNHIKAQMLLEYYNAFPIDSLAQDTFA